MFEGYQERIDKEITVLEPATMEIKEVAPEEKIFKLNWRINFPPRSKHHKWK
jgi:hypothetical protein